MSRKWLNLAQTKPADPEAAGHRKAIFTTSLALIAFYLAKGKLGCSSTIMLLPMSFGRPVAILWILYVMWAYYIYRYAQVSGATPFREFWRELKLLTYDFRPLVEVARRCYRSVLKPRAETDDGANRLRFLEQGWIPTIQRQGLRLMGSTDRMWRPQEQPSATSASRIEPFQLPPSALAWYFVAHVVAVARAALLERAFFDQLLPYVVAIIALALSVLGQPIELSACR